MAKVARVGKLEEMSFADEAKYVGGNQRQREAASKRGFPSCVPRSERCPG